MTQLIVFLVPFSCVGSHRPTRRMGRSDAGALYFGNQPGSIRPRNNLQSAIAKRWDYLRRHAKSRGDISTTSTTTQSKLGNTPYTPWAPIWANTALAYNLQSALTKQWDYVRRHAEFRCDLYTTTITQTQLGNTQYAPWVQTWALVALHALQRG